MALGALAASVACWAVARVTCVAVRITARVVKFDLIPCGGTEMAVAALSRPVTAYFVAV